MTGSTTLQAQRNQLYTDLYNNILPERLPVACYYSYQIVAANSGLDPIGFQYDFDQFKTAVSAICQKAYSDSCPVAGAGNSTRLPGFYQLLGSSNFVMGANGYMQHPEGRSMEANEYETLIADPLAFLLERAIPRLYGRLDPKEPMRMLRDFLLAKTDRDRAAATIGAALREVIQENGYYTGAPAGSAGFVAAPYDFLADQLRGFTQISMDIRRDRQKVKEACEALYPLMFALGLPAVVSPRGLISCPLHMPPFMREKDFVEIWLPTFRRLCQEYAALGIRINAFCEADWTRYLDIIASEFPAGIQLRFEKGDPRLIKEKLGKKFLLGGMYPLSLLKYGTREQCVDKAKELLDIMMPGGGYVFGFDKMALMMGDIDFDNLNAVAEYVRDNARYSNAGESFGMPLNAEGLDFTLDRAERIVSRYAFDGAAFLEEYPMVPESFEKRLRSNESAFVKTILNLLV